MLQELNSGYKSVIIIAQNTDILVLYKYKGIVPCKGPVVSFSRVSQSCFTEVNKKHSPMGADD